MKKIFAILLASSILLTQCYTQNEYLTKDFSFDKNDKLTKVVLEDSTEREFSFNESNYRIESDSLLITYNSIREPSGDYFKFITVIDTLRIKKIHSLFVSEFDSGLTIASVVAAGLLVIGIIIYAEAGLTRIY